MSKPLSNRARAAVARFRKAQAHALGAGLDASKAIAEAVASGSAPARNSDKQKSPKPLAPAAQPGLRPGHS